MRLGEMTGKRRATTSTNNNMQMQRGFAFRRPRHVCEPRGHLDLLVERNSLLPLPLPIEIIELDAAEGTDGTALNGRNAPALRAIAQRLHDLITGLTTRRLKGIPPGGVRR